MSKFKKVFAVAIVLCMIVTAFAACSLTPASKLVGSWRDSTSTTGYEFKKDNICTITYADVTIPILNYRYNGTIDGAYTVEKRDDGNYYVTITYTILSKSVSESYMFKVEGDVLTLTAVEDGTVKTLMAYTPEPSTVPPTSTPAASNAPSAAA